MRALGAYFSRQKPKGLGARDPKLVKAGERVWRGGDVETDVPACAGCHSPTGAGIPKNFPKVSGQYADYTYGQLKAFKAGERGNDAGGKDADGRIMPRPNTSHDSDFAARYARLTSVISSSPRADGVSPAAMSSTRLS